MDFKHKTSVEKWGDDVESAVRLALDELNLTKDQVNVTVLEEPSRGFFGIGSKLALVRVEKIEEPVEEETPEEPAPVEIVNIEERLEQFEKNAEHKVEEREARPERRENSKSRNRNRKRKPRNNKKAAEAPILPELDLKKDFENLPVCEDHPAVDFLKDVTEQMGLKLNMEVRADEKHVFVDISGDDSGTIIGKRGQTLDAIQYLTSLVVNKGNSDYIKVVIDAENYRSKRERALEQLADRTAHKVIRSRKPYKFEPMNPYERKVIHATLQHNPAVSTRSEGKDPYRRIIVELVEDN